MAFAEILESIAEVHASNSSGGTTRRLEPSRHSCHRASFAVETGHCCAEPLSFCLRGKMLLQRRW